MKLVLQLVVAVFIVYIARTNSIRKAPTVSLTPKNIRGVKKGMVYMLCNTTGIPRPNITLYKDGVKVTNSRIYKFKILHGWFIRIGPLKQRHQGTYRCEAANGVGPVVSDSSAILRVYQARTTPSGFPRIGRSPRSQFKKSGEKIIFQCTVTGTPNPSIMWLQNKVPLSLSNRRFSVSANGDLTITNLEKADKGSYACVAENSKGMVISRDARLFVREVRRPPKFTVLPLGQTVNPDSDVYLNCSAVGFPKPTMVWELDGRRISGGGNGYLFISRIQRSGNYTCIADSFMGRVKAYAFVRVKLLPFAPTRPSATTITPNSITITWQSSGSHVVTSFVIEHKLKTETQWRTSSIRGTMTLKISNLQPYSIYQFRVLAVNSLGKSGPSPVAEFKTSPSKPSSPPINITAKGVSDTSFRADWNPPLSPNGTIRGYRVYYSLDQKEAFSQWRFMASATNHATISGLTKQTTYFFKIAAYNIAGVGPASQVMTVKTHKGGNVTILSDKMTSLVKASLNDKVVLSCYATGAPPIRYIWTKDGAPINNSSINVIGNTVIVEPKTAGDYGTYLCQATNGNQTASYEVKLELSEICQKINISSQQDLKILREKMTSLIKAAIGQNISIGCYAAGTQPIRYNWTKDGSQISSSAVKVIDNILFVQPKTPMDYGTYLCSVSNQNKSVSYPVELSPWESCEQRSNSSENTGKLQILREKMTPLVRARYGDKVSIGCYATGAPPIKYSWTKNNHPIVNSEAIKVLENVVVVRPNTTADYGTFVCSSSNGRETASYVIKLEHVDV